MIRSSRSSSDPILILPFAGMLLAGAVTAQPLTDIGLFNGAAPNTLEVRVRPDAAFSQLVSAVTFTVRWETASGATIAPPASLVLGLNCPSGIPLAASPDGTVTNGAFSYYTFNAFSLAQLSSACASQVWAANIERAIASIPIRPGTTCARFNIVNDTFTASQNKDFYLALNSVERDDQIYSTEVKVLRGDINRDGSVNATDFSLFAGAFGGPCSGCAADLDFNGPVNTSDFSLFVGAFGRTCP